MNPYTRKALRTLCLSTALLLGGAALGSAQERPDIGAHGSSAPGGYRQDTVRLRIGFPSGVDQVRLDYDGNALAVEYFREALSYLLSRDGAFMSGLFIRTVASPDGTTVANIELSQRRSDAVREFVCREFGLSPFNVHTTSGGEDWDVFADAVAALSPGECPWRDDALAIIRGGEQYEFNGRSVSDRRKVRLQALEGGKAWSYLKEHVFPSLRAAYGDALLVVSTPPQATADTAEEPTEPVQTVRDTVIVKEIVEVEYNGRADRRFNKKVDGKSFLFSLKTNIFAIPLINVGVEFPFSKRFSLELDYYYPFMPRSALNRECYQLIAYDMAVRYWIPSDRFPEEARLLGHSFGLYGAGGHYDFERDWTGHQGTFFNIGVDWKYAWPIFHGAMHMEIELGLGMIYSDAQPYDVFIEYGDCFRRPDERRIVRWYGPTRAQLTLVVPIYRRPFTGGRSSRGRNDKTDRRNAR